MGNILITGGAGYIGSHVIKQLGELTNHNIFVVDNLSTGRKEAVLYGKFIEAELTDLAKIDNIIKENKIDSVIHFAASMVVPESIENPLKYYLNNTVNTANLINLCVKNNVSKFIFSSTAAVYGEPIEIPISENHPLNPINPYGMSKLMSERIIMDAEIAHKNFKYVIFRYFNVAGASIDGKIGQSFPNATHLIKVAAEASCGKREKIFIYGNDYETPDGTGIRDYIHVEDLASAHVKALEYLDNNESDIFNVGYGQGYSVLNVINTMKSMLGKDFEVNYVDRRSGDPSAVIANASKIREKMQWEAKYNSINVICKTALDWEKKIAATK